MTRRVPPAPEPGPDALLVSAESGAGLTMIHPEYSIVIPEGASVTVPAILPLRDDEPLQRLVNSWIEFRAGGRLRRVIGGAAPAT